MTTPTPDRTRDESHAFVVRLRVNASPDPSLQPQLPQQTGGGEGRLFVQIEHVNSSDFSLHHSIESALDWLRDRMAKAADASPSGDWHAPDEKRH
ncbi:hypothetical protein RGUI_3694 [Rhodovulum sp. P5]|uniref:hypothetical protein n=1 Tax=Rhodovulum sp. P5 TaxID=1564506 RepID=UPI0009C3D583|nr:hypothetical protein [Rhodovulum sp. P5]ARE41835.1 hypothetical protein RGUI_3694 [Rhodovulum sp. P5]